MLRARAVSPEPLLSPSPSNPASFFALAQVIRDLLPQLVSFVHPRPRVLVLSLVCKLWRDAVRRSVASWRLTTRFNASSFPNITSLQTSSWIAPSELGLSRLNLLELHMPVAIGEFGQQLPSSLTSLLMLDFYTDGRRLLKSSAHTLRRLCLIGSVRTPSVAPHIRQLPHLTSLTLESFVTVSPEFISALSHVCPRLTELSLSIRLSAVLNELAIITFPSLVRLYASVDDRYLPILLPMWIAAAPLLRSLELRLFLIGQPEHILSVIRQSNSILTGLEMWGGSFEAKALVRELKLCTRLRSLTLEGFADTNALIDLYGVICPSEVCVCRSLKPLAVHANRFTALTVLELRNVTGLEWPAQISLPLLRKLTYRVANAALPSFPDVLRFLGKITQDMAHLHTLRVQLYRCTEQRQTAIAFGAKNFAEFCHLLDRRGVECLEWDSKLSECESIVAYAARDKTLVRQLSWLELDLNTQPLDGIIAV